MTALLGTIAGGALLGVTATALVFGFAPPGADAGSTVASCTKAPDLRYDCTRLLNVNDHIEMNANGGVCHSNVVLAGTISATLKSAKVEINHNVSNCPWQPGGTTTFGYRVTGTPTPSGDAVSVGGISGLLDGDSDAEDVSGSTRGSASGAVMIAVAGAATVALSTALAVRMRKTNV